MYVNVRNALIKKYLKKKKKKKKNKVVGVASKSERTKPIIKRRKEHCDWLILLLLLPTPTISGFHEIANDGVVSGSRKKMETS